MNPHRAAPPHAKVCAIHQPNFFPWLGYFEKVRRSDVFVFLDAVAYPKSGSGAGSWVNRVRIAVNGAPAWVTCPIRREHGVQLIRDVRIDDRQPWRRKLLRTLEVNYGRAPNFPQFMPLIEKLVQYETDSLCRFNAHAVTALCAELGMSSRFLFQSECGVASASTQLLVDLTKAAGADTYLSGDGSGAYLQEDLFPASGLRLEYLNFRPHAYGDPARFLPGLSVLDYLMRADPGQIRAGLPGAVASIQAATPGAEERQ